MKIPQFIAVATLAVLISIEAWTLKTVIEVKVSLASLTQRVDDSLPRRATNLTSPNLANLTP